MKRLPASLSYTAFRQAWAESRDSKSGAVAGAPGVDGVHVARFASELDRQIEDIRRKLRDGTFQFNRLRFAPLLKRSGGHRIIAIPTVRDRLVQRALLRGLESDNRFNASSPIAYGFTKGRSLADAQRAACSWRAVRPWTLQVDIIKFFDRIDRLQLEKLIRQKVRGRAVSTLLCQAIHCEIEDVGGKGGDIIRESGIQIGQGLRQGMPLSPMLSNLLLKSFDHALGKQGFVALRYADDIAVFGNSRHELLGALSFIKETLEQLNLDVPDLSEEGKTTISGPSEAVEFLGVEIRRKDGGYILVAPNGKIEAIEEQMGLVASLNECIKLSRNIGQVVRGLDAFIIGHKASMAVLNDPKSFFDRLEAAKQRKLNKLLIELIGEKAVKALDDDRRAVLGLQTFR